MKLGPENLTLEVELQAHLSPSCLLYTSDAADE